MRRLLLLLAVLSLQGCRETPRRSGSPVKAQIPDTVWVTTKDLKYHRKGCWYLDMYQPIPIQR